jgi:hypothetical protein
MVAAAACAAMLAGCAAAPNAPSASRQDIALIDVPEPPRLVVSIVGHPDASASQTRRMFYQNEVRDVAIKLAAALRPADLHPGAMTTAALASALSVTQRQPVLRAADPQPGREELLEDYTQVRTTAARDLDVVPAAIGYWRTYPGGPYRPWVILSYRLRDNATGRVLASGTIGSGPSPGEGPLSSVPADDRFAFPSFAALTAEPQRAAEGLRVTVQRVADALAASF